MKTFDSLLYNLGPLSERVTNSRAGLEIRSHAHATEADKSRREFEGLAYTECMGRRMPNLERYKRHRAAKPGQRRNVTLYLLERLDSGPAEWWDSDVWWWRPLAPSRKHEPRSTLWVPAANDWMIGVGHAPQEERDVFPDKVNESLARAREDWLQGQAQTIRGYIAKGKKVVLLGDTNGLAAELRQRVPKLVMKNHGVDSVHTTEVITHFDDDNQMGGVASWSDHHSFVTSTIKQRT